MRAESRFFVAGQTGRLNVYPMGSIPEVRLGATVAGPYDRETAEKVAKTGKVLPRTPSTKGSKK